MHFMLSVASAALQQILMKLMSLFSLFAKLLKQITQSNVVAVSWVTGPTIDRQISTRCRFFIVGVNTSINFAIL